MTPKLVCLDCDGLLNPYENDSCPKCGSDNIFIDDFEVDWDLGHFEGDFTIGVNSEEIE